MIRVTTPTIFQGPLPAERTVDSPFFANPHPRCAVAREAMSIVVDAISIVRLKTPRPVLQFPSAIGALTGVAKALALRSYFPVFNPATPWWHSDVVHL